jgi:hypothetical protein
MGVGKDPNQIPTENLYVVGITRAIMRVMRFIQLQVTRQGGAMPIKHLGILNGFLTEFLTVALTEYLPNTNIYSRIPSSSTSRKWRNPN